MSSNTITISKSCLTRLPAGDYHYSVFESLDVFKHDCNAFTYEELAEELDLKDEEYKQLEKSVEVLHEQLAFARDLLDSLENLTDSTSRLPKSYKADFKNLLSETLFER